MVPNENPTLLEYQYGAADLYIWQVALKERKKVYNGLTPVPFISVQI